MGGEGGMGGESAGEGGIGPGQAGETGSAGEGGSPTATMCLGMNFSMEHLSTTAGQNHDHFPLGAMLRSALINQINSGSPLTLSLPDDGAADHSHDLIFTAMQFATLRNGGAIAMITSSEENGHTHTYTLECEP
jgi:hypothetical protein